MCGQCSRNPSGGVGVRVLSKNAEIFISMFIDVIDLLTAALTDILLYFFALQVRCEGVGRHTVLGTTIDDSLGEAFDKVARLLGITAVPGRCCACDNIQTLVQLSHEGNASCFTRPKVAVHRHTRCSCRTVPLAQSRDSATQ